MQIADMVRDEVGNDVDRSYVTPTNDHRSYHVSSEKIALEARVRAASTRSRTRCAAWSPPSGTARCPNSLTDPRISTSSACRAQSEIELAHVALAKNHQLSFRARTDLGPARIGVQKPESAEPTRSRDRNLITWDSDYGLPGCRFAAPE